MALPLLGSIGGWTAGKVKQKKNTNMAPNNKQTKNKQQNSDKTEDDRDKITTTWNKFWMVKACKSGELEGVSPFSIQKHLQSNIGDGIKTKRLRTGDLLVEVASANQAEQIRKNVRIHTVKTTSEPHRTLNFRRGVVRCPDLKGMADDSLQREWASQGISEVKRICAFRGGENKPTDTLILTFKHHSLPKEITAGYMRLPVSTYIPLPLRCFKCQKYGHHRNNCGGQASCQICSEEGHDSKECTNGPHCRNCTGDHPPGSGTCPQWTIEKRIWN